MEVHEKTNVSSTFTPVLIINQHSDKQQDILLYDSYNSIDLLLCNQHKVVVGDIFTDNVNVYLLQSVMDTYCIVSDVDGNNPIKKKLSMLNGIHKVVLSTNEKHNVLPLHKVVGLNNVHMYTERLFTNIGDLELIMHYECIHDLTQRSAEDVCYNTPKGVPLVNYTGEVFRDCKVTDTNLNGYGDIQLTNAPGDFMDGSRATSMLHMFNRVIDIKK